MSEKKNDQAEWLTKDSLDALADSAVGTITRTRSVLLAQNIAAGLIFIAYANQIIPWDRNVWERTKTDVKRLDYCSKFVGCDCTAGKHSVPSPKAVLSEDEKKSFFKGHQDGVLKDLWIPLFCKDSDPSTSEATNQDKNKEFSKAIADLTSLKTADQLDMKCASMCVDLYQKKKAADNLNDAIWKELYSASIPVLGIKIYGGDVGSVGSAGMLFISMWFWYVSRSERSAIRQLALWLSRASTPDFITKAYNKIMHTLVFEVLFNRPSESEKPSQHLRWLLFAGIPLFAGAILLLNSRAMGPNFFTNGGAWQWSVPFVVMAFIPLIAFVISKNSTNKSKSERSKPYDVAWISKIIMFGAPVVLIAFMLGADAISSFAKLTIAASAQSDAPYAAWSNSERVEFFFRKSFIFFAFSVSYWFAASSWNIASRTRQSLLLIWLLDKRAKNQNSLSPEESSALIAASDSKSVDSIMKQIAKQANFADESLFKDLLSGWIKMVEKQSGYRLPVQTIPTNEEQEDISLKNAANEASESFKKIADGMSLMAEKSGKTTAKLDSAVEQTIQIGNALDSLKAEIDTIREKCKELTDQTRKLMPFDNGCGSFASVRNPKEIRGLVEAGPCRPL